MSKIHLPGDGMPPVTFKNFVTELASSALVCLGYLENPITKAKQVDLPRAGHVIGLLEMLEEKSSGNLTEEESAYLQTVLTDLQVKYREQQPRQD
ncbi:MAG: DUF1844 domain-containing protein [Planctomycetota bacterium]